MSRVKAIPDDTPVQHLTAGQLRAILREAIEGYTPSYGSEADTEASTLLVELRELRELVDDLQIDLNRVMTRLGIES